MNLRNLQKLIICTVVMIIAPFTYADNSSKDKAISESIKQSLAKERDIPSKDINITTLDGIVGIQGTVDTKLQAHRVIEIASSVDGVIDVEDSGLEVKSSESFLNDAMLTAKAKGKIKYLAVHGKISKNYDLHVETTDKVVHIFGKVAKKEDINVIKLAVQGIKGVDYVKTSIDVI